MPLIPVKITSSGILSTVLLVFFGNITGLGTRLGESLRTSLGLLSTVFLVLVGNWKVATGRGLVLVANIVGDSLILGLLSSRLVALIACPEELFLNEVDS